MSKNDTLFYRQHTTTGRVFVLRNIGFNENIVELQQIIDKGSWKSDSTLRILYNAVEFIIGDSGDPPT